MEELVVNRTEAEEQEHLAWVREKIEVELDQISGKAAGQYSDVLELKQYLQNSKADMDHVEKVSVRQSIEQMTMVGEHTVARRNSLSKLLVTPYFGRIDFKPDNRSAHPIYIGLHSFYDADRKRHWVYDWRAPISSMFYDFELGPAFYDAPEGRTEGALALKRQYRIEEGRLVFMLETSLNIQDDILQEELSRASSDRMKNIVATIQRDQNAIIRNDEAHALVIQGAAGSGKTSIALHRIAYLLYKFKDSIRSEEILIISPNKVFAHYISQVLPELGEEMIKETTMEALADLLLAHQVTFQTFYEQVATLLSARSKKFVERIRYKATPEYLSRLDEFVAYVKQYNFTPKPLTVGAHVLSAEWLAERLRACGVASFSQQVTDVTDAVVDRIKIEYGVDVTSKQRTEVRSAVKKMFWATDIHKLYSEFYDWAGAPEMFKLGKGRVYEYSDVYPLIYLQMQLEGAASHDQIKHLVIDEMQDYTPVQYRVIAQLLPCRKTVLGDFNQSVNPYGSSTAEIIQAILPRAQCMYMHKSYRSTVEITDFAQQIQPNPNLVPIERHGESPEVLAFEQEDEEVAWIRKQLAAFQKTGRKSLGVICKTQDQADALYEKLKDTRGRVHLINPKSTVFSGGIMVATAHLVKGLEFDEVIVPSCDDKTYRELIDRHMLYVACTRAMHKLSLTHTGKRSRYVP